MTSPESVFSYGEPQLKFGMGAADEIGFELSQYGVRRVYSSATSEPTRSASSGSRRFRKKA
jgi:hypothetical protein